MHPIFRSGVGRSHLVPLTLVSIKKINSSETKIAVIPENKRTTWCK